MPEFEVEKKLLILTSRMTINDETKNEICELLDNKINWFEFTKYAMYHKTYNLCWYNILEIKPDIIVPKFLYDTYLILYKEYEERNKLYFLELENVKETLVRNGVNCLPVKGSMLIPMIYKNYGIRFMGDVDCLIKHEDINAVEKTMYELGYVYGKYNPKKKIIDKVSRMDQIKWKAFMTNLYPFQKISNKDPTFAYKFDFRYCLDDSLSYDPINEIINKYTIKQKVDPAHVLIHLCAHFYSEAKHTASIYVCKDFNIIKLCDIREYILMNLNTDIFNNVLSFSKKYTLEKQVYFTLYHLHMIYNDGYEIEIMKRFDFIDLSFINTYGVNTNDENKVFIKSFWNRIFDGNNAGELQNKPSFFSN